MIPEKKKRKTRSDKGEIRATKRDLECIGWIAEQYAARGDQIQRLLTRYPDPQHPPKDDLVSESTTREQLSRWQRAGWVVYKRMLAQGPGWAYVTKAGLEMVDLDFPAKPPSVKRLSHIYAVNQVRLWMDQRRPWVSERRIRASFNLQRGESSGPIPDGLVVVNGNRVAIEVQISALPASEWEVKLRGLLLAYQKSNYEQLYPTVWCYVPTAAMKKAVEKAAESLRDQGYVSAVVQDDLLMEEEEWY